MIILLEFRNRKKMIIQVHNVHLFLFHSVQVLRRNICTLLCWTHMGGILVEGRRKHVFFNNTPMNLKLKSQL